MSPPDLRSLIREGNELEARFDTLPDSGPVFESCLADIRAWLERCVDHGRFLPNPSPDRRALQGRVDYWTSLLSQHSHPLPNIDRIADFDPLAGSPLGVDFPYPGLIAYSEAQKQLFCGREREVTDYVAHLEYYFSLLLVSESGGGKSSLAMAGVLPKLKESHSDWLFAPRMTPGARPIEALIFTLRTVLPELPEHLLRDGTDSEDGVEKYGAATRPILDILNQRNLLLFVDQLEELLTLCNDARQQAGFSVLLAKLAEAGPCRVLATMRSDYQHQLANSLACHPLFALLAANDGVKTLAPLGFDQIRAAILKPAEMVGLRFVPPAIVDKLAQQTANLVGGLPLLQFALWRLWKSRPTMDGKPLDLINDRQLEALPSVLEALGTAAEAEYTDLTSASQTLCKRLMLELTIPAENYEDPIRRRRRESEVMQVLLIHGQAGVPNREKLNVEQILKLIDRFVDARLLIRSGEGENRQIEVAHESIFRNWPRFRDWVSGEETKVRLQAIRLIGREAAQWANQGRTVDYLKLKGEPLARAQRYKGDGWLEEVSCSYVEQCAGEEQRTAQTIRSVKRIKGIAVGMVAVIVMLIAAVWSCYPYYKEWRSTWGVLNDLKKMNEVDRQRHTQPNLNNLAMNLWRKSTQDPKAVDTLLSILYEADRAGLFDPAYYPFTDGKESERSIEQMKEKKKPTIVSLEYPKLTRLNGMLLQKHWGDFATILRTSNPAVVRKLLTVQEFATTGFLIPAWLTVKPIEDEKVAYQLKITQVNAEETQSRTKDTTSVGKPKPKPSSLDQKNKSADQPGNTVQFTSSTETLDLGDVDYDSSQVLLSEDNIDRFPNLKELLHSPANQLQVRKAFEKLGLPGWLWVPRWTLPIWKAARYEGVYPPEAGVAIHGITKLRSEKERLYSDGFIARILQQQASPQTIQLACQASGGAGKLIDDIKSMLAWGVPISQLQSYLEKTANRVPAGDAANCDFNRLWAVVRNDSNIAYFAEEMDEAMTAGAFTPKPPLQVVIAPDLLAYIAPSETLDEDVASRIAELRGRIIRDWGFRVPGIRFSVGEGFQPGQFTIEVRDKADTARFSVAHFSVAQGQEVDDILARLHEHLARTGPLWIDMEEVARLVDSLPKNLNNWLAKHYFLAELKPLLQEVLTEGWAKRPKLKDVGVDESPSPSASLAHFPWLIRSLVFWEEACGHANYTCLGKGLRETQQARVMAKFPDKFPNQPMAAVPGMAALASDRFDEAGNAFKQWLSVPNSVAMRDEFARSYGAAAAQLEYWDLKKACSPKPGQFAAQEEILLWSAITPDKITAFMDDYGHVLPAPLRRRIALCRISSGLQQGSETSDLFEAVWHEMDENKDWMPTEKYWLGYLALKAHLGSKATRDKTPPARLEQIGKLFRVAVPDLPSKQAEPAFEEIVRLCTDPSAGIWCLEMLKPWPDLRPDSYWIPLELAYSFSLLNRDGANLALRLLDRAERNLGHVEKNWRGAQRTVLAFTRGLAHQTLGKTGAEGEFNQAIRYFRQSATQSRKAVGELGPGMSYAMLAGAFRRNGDPARAANTVAQGHKLTHNPDQLLTEEEIMLLWNQGRFDDAVTRLKDKSDEASLYMRSLSSMLGQKTRDTEALKADVGAFLKTTHELRDYLRLIYYWTLMRDGKKVEARKVLEDRWNEIDPASWPARLQSDRGDYMAVWREKLVGYYLGSEHVPEKEITDLMENPSKFEASPFNYAEQSRQGFLCEWYFYDGLLQSVTGSDPETMRNRLRERLTKAVDTRQLGFHEYMMAKDLIRRMDSRENLVLQNSGISPSQ